MVSIRKDIVIDASADIVWEAVRAVGAVHDRLTPGVVVDTRLDGDVRTVTFASGAVAQELVVGVDEPRRRLAYAVIDSPLKAAHHSASMQVFAHGPRQSRIVWNSDVYPSAIAPVVEGVMDKGAKVMRATLAAEQERRRRGKASPSPPARLTRVEPPVEVVVISPEVEESVA